MSDYEVPKDFKYLGNIDLGNRKKLVNDDGSISTESSISIGTDAGEVIIPTVIDGVRFTTDDAIKHYRKTGKHLGIYKTPQDAETAAFNIHLMQQKKYAGGE